jgi:hypothetical protein
MVDVLLATTLEGVNTKALQKLVYKLLLLYFINLEYAVFFERTVRVKSLWVIIKGQLTRIWYHTCIPLDSGSLRHSRRSEPGG